MIDARQPRNRFADASHGFLGFDGSDPKAILAKARDQLAAYPSVQMIEAEAIAGRSEGGVRCYPGEQRGDLGAQADPGLWDARYAGLDPGLQERWGKTVLHCPYCHGFEFSDRQLGVLYRMPMSVHQAVLVAEWGPTTLYLNGAELDRERRADARQSRR